MPQSTTHRWIRLAGQHSWQAGSPAHSTVVHQVPPAFMVPSGGSRLAVASPVGPEAMRARRGTRVPVRGVAPNAGEGHARAQAQVHIP
jgi:hypothetical protein